MSAETSRGPAEPDSEPPEAPPNDDEGSGAPSPGPSRRALLKRGLFGGLLLGAGGLFAWQTSGYIVPAEVAARLEVLSGKEWLILRAAAARILRDDPEPGELAAPTPDELGVADWIDGWLSRQSGRIQSDVKLLLNALEHSPPLLELVPSRFTRADDAARDRILAGWMRSRLAVRKQGFHALKGLCLMGYFRHPSSWPMIGYGGPMVRAESSGGG